MEEVSQYTNEMEMVKKLFNPLWTAVTSFMLHGPYGQYNPSLSCMVDGHCQFGYPKNYQATTEISEDGYPQYHQCEDPDKVYKVFSHGKPYVFTNHDVVPYNKYLLYKYDCHFNVEFCYSVQAIKYTLKHLYKGSDQETVTVEDYAEETEKTMKLKNFKTSAM